MQYSAIGRQTFEGDIQSLARALSDVGPAGDGVCTFQLSLCFNVSDTRIPCLAPDKLSRIRVTYPNGRRVIVPVGLSVLEVSRSVRIPHASVCGGRGRCSTCRVRILTARTQPPPDEAESRVLRLVSYPNRKQWPGVPTALVYESEYRYALAELAQTLAPAHDQGTPFSRRELVV